MTDEELVEIKRRLTAVEAEIDSINTAIEIAPPTEPPIVVEPEPPITVPPEPKPPVTGEDKYPKQPPAPTAALRVPEDYPSVMAALDAARPGDTISCDNGYKCGELTPTKDFDPTNPVIVRARNVGRAEFDKRVRLRGQGYWVHGFKSTSKVSSNGPGDGAIVVEADFLNLTKLEIQSPHGISAPGTNRRGINIGWCRFNGQNPTGGGVSNIYFHLPLGGLGERASDLPRNIHIYRNEFDDAASRAPGSHEDHCVYFGPSKPRGNDLLAMEDVELYQNLIRDNNRRVRGFYMKRGCRMTQNSLLGLGYNWGIRHGGDSVFEANIATGKYKLVLNGAGTRVLNNICTQIQLYAGMEPDPLYQAADRAFLDSNTGPLLVGYLSPSKRLSLAEGGRCGNVLVCNHNGKITINDDGCERVTYRYDPRAQGDYLPRLPLSPADVGVAG